MKASKTTQMHAQKSTRSWALLALGGIIFSITVLLILKGLPGDDASPDGSMATTTESRPKLSPRKSDLSRPPSLARSSSLADESNITANEQLISQIVGSGRSVHEIAEDLLKLFPESKGSEQVLVASHLGHLADAEQLDDMVSYLSDPRINSKSKEMIFNSIYDSEPKQVASLLIKVIENGVQEYSDEAQKGLSILLQADHGLDVAAWRRELDSSGDSLDAEDITE